MSVNNNLFRFENLVSEYTKYISETNIKNVKLNNPHWMPNYNNKINRIIHILEGGNTIRIYELNFVINLCIIKKLFYIDKSFSIPECDIDLIQRYLMYSLGENFKNLEAVNLAGFKMIIYHKGEILGHIYKTDVDKDIEKIRLPAIMDTYIRTLYL